MIIPDYQQDKTFQYILTVINEYNTSIPEIQQMS